MKVGWKYNTSDMSVWLSIMYESSQRTQWNQRVFHNLQSHLTFCYNEWFIFPIIYECLVKIKHFRHAYSLILCKIRKKRNKIKKHSITFSHIWDFHTLVLIRYTISESLEEIQQLWMAWMVVKNVWKYLKKAIKSKAIP